MKSHYTAIQSCFNLASFTGPGLVVLPFIAATLLAISGATQAQTWDTVDDAEGATGEGVYKITSDGAGNIFAAGYLRDATQRYHGIVMKRSIGGTSWGIVADYPAVNDPAAPNGPFAGFTAIASADLPGGDRHLVVAGMDRRVSRPGIGHRPQWLIIRSINGGAWETLNEYLHPTYDSSLTPRDVAVDASGNIYVVGMAKVSVAGTGNSNWLIRKGLATTGGMVWSTVGDFSYADGYDSEHGFNADGACSVSCVGTNVYVAGGGGNSWVVRKNSNGGNSWAVVDSYRYNKQLKSHAHDIAADSAGNLYAAGFGNKLGRRWIVRTSTNGGSTWSTVDEFRLPSGSYGEANAIAIDTNNNVHVTGMASTTQVNWVTRQRSAATGTWTTSEVFSLAPNQTSWGKSITADPSGNLFAAGYGYDAGGVNHGWFVRRKQAP